MAVHGVVHAPTNELGVIYVFGAVGGRLGFVVSRMGRGFPDCEAMRRLEGVDGRGGERWERVRVEFEFRSSNFVSHGHDPAGCDVIVCWEHDWAECPVEVVELRRVVMAAAA